MSSKGKQNNNTKPKPSALVGGGSGAMPEKKGAGAATKPSPNTKDQSKDKKPKQNLQREAKKNSDAPAKNTNVTEDVDTITEEDLLMPGATWFHMYENLPKLDAAKQANRQPPTREQILALKQKAEKLYDELVQKFEKDATSKKKGRGNDEAWMQTVLKSGTVTDKMAAMTLSVQAATLHRLRVLETLINLANKKGRREAIMSIDTLKDLFLNNLLPSNRKLIPFHKRPVDHPDVKDVHLIYWYFEDCLKEIYADFVNSLDKWSSDNIFYAKRKAQDVAHEMLSEKPEQEQHLLEILIKKMGDNENKIASNSVYLLTLLLERHPAMKLSVVKEVETFLHRPHVSLRAQYYAVIFLNQVILSKNNVDLSKKLLEIYFSLFKKLVTIQNNIESKMLSGLLTGVNRAFPFAPIDPAQFEEQMDTLFKVVHIASFNKSVQALLLIFQVMFAQQNITDRFYRAVYAKLLSHEIFSSSRVGLFLNVLFKAMKNDKNATRVKAFIKRLLQVSLYQKPTFACGALFLVSEILKTRSELRDSLIEQPEKRTVLEVRLAQKALEVLGGAEKALPASAESDDEDGGEKKPNKKKAPVPKRDVLYFTGKPRLTAKPSKAGSAPATPQKDDGIQLNLAAPKPAQPAPADPRADSAEKEDAASPDVMNVDEDLTPEAIEHRLNSFDIKTTRLTGYDAAAREPSYCGAQNSSLWELTLLSQHFHPTVSLWALHILAGHPIDYPGDPLRDMSLQAFLDRFMYKNPKNISRKKVEAASTTKAARKLMRQYDPAPERAHSVNTPEFMQKAEKNNVAPDELFFYKFFKQKEQLHPKEAEQSSRRVGDDEDDAEDLLDDESVDFDVSEDEAERAVLEGLEEIEGSKIYDRKAMKEAEEESWSYSDLGESDFEEGSDVEEEAPSKKSKKAKKDSAKFDDDDIFGAINEASDDEDVPELGDEEEEDEDNDDMDMDEDDEDMLDDEDDEALNEMLAEEAGLDGVGADSEEEDGEDGYGLDEDQLDEVEDEDEKPQKSGGKKKKSKFSKSSFASLDQFADLLEKSGFGDEPQKQSRWEDKKINNAARARSNAGGGQKRKRGPSGGGFQSNKRRKGN